MSLAGTIKSVFCPIHKAGYPFIAIFAVVTFLLGLWSTNLLWIGIILTLWCVYFFRNPERYVPQGEGVLVASGDGKVQMITDVIPPAELELGDEPLTRVSIFLNVFNVHVNRSPIAGVIKKIHYHKGKFLNAELDKASMHNERNSIVVTTKDGQDIAFVQIAGFVARRIICDVEEGQELQTGEYYGLIRFGSRCDIYLPKGVEPQVAVGQTTIGGETIIANLTGGEKATVKKL